MRRTRFLFFLSLFLISSITVTGINKTLIQDSLIQLIINEKRDEDKLKHYHTLVQFLQHNEVGLSVSYCDSAISFAQRSKMPYYYFVFSLERARGLIMKGSLDEASFTLHKIESELAEYNSDKLWGHFYLVKNLAYITVKDYANAMENGLKAITYLNKVKDSLALSKAYNNIGVIYEYTSNRQKALEYYLLAQDYAIQLDNQDMIGDLYNNIGIVYDELGDNQQALNYYYKSLETNNRLTKHRGMAMAFSNIASVLLEMERYDESYNNYFKALALYSQNKYKPGVASIYEHLGKYHTAVHNYDSATMYFNRCSKLYAELADNYALAVCLKDMGELYLLQNQVNSALHAFKKVYFFANDGAHFTLRQEAAMNLSKTYYLVNNFKLAYDYQLVALQIADSIAKMKMNEDLKHSELQIEFRNQTRKYKSELDRYKQSQIKANKKKFTERILFGILFVGTLFIAIVLFRNYRSTIHLNSRLIKQNREIEDQKALIEISNVELLEQYTFTETLLNTIPNPVYYTDKNSTIIGCNKAFEVISGRKNEDLVGTRVSDLNLKSMLSCDTTKLFGNPGKNMVRSDGTMVYKDKKDHDVIVYRQGIVNSDSRLIGTLGIIIDISDIKKAERDLQNSQKKLKEAIAAKDKFFNIMAHDLKNPFNAIMGLTSLLIEQFDKHTKEDLRQFVVLINQSTTNVYSLLENLLEWARAQSGSIDIHPATFPIVDVIQETLNLFSQSLDRKNMTINFDKTEYLVYADKNMTKTIFRNLLSNAIKYSFNESVIDIKLDKGDEWLYVRVEDHGVGIKAESIDNIFKIDQPTTTPGVNNERGTGLGLIICQEFVKLNGGTMLVQSEPGKGSQFTFSLPLVM